MGLKMRPKRDLEGRLESSHTTGSSPNQHSHHQRHSPEVLHYPPPSRLDMAAYKLLHWLDRKGARGVSPQPAPVSDSFSNDARITHGLTAAQLASEVDSEFDPVWYAMQQADGKGTITIASYLDYLDNLQEQEQQPEPSFLGMVARYAALAAPAVGVAAVVAASLFHPAPAHATPDSLDSVLMASHAALGVPAVEDMALSDKDIAEDWKATVDHVKQAKTYHQLLPIYTSQITSRGAKYSGISTVGTNQYFAFTLTPPDDPTNQDRIRSVNYAFYNLMQDFNLSQEAMRRIIATYLDVNFDLYVPVKDIKVHVTSDRVDFSYIGTNNNVLRDGPLMNRRKTKWDKGRPPNAILWSPKEGQNTIYVDVNDLMPAYPAIRFKEEADRAARESREREAVLSRSLEFDKGVLILSAMTAGNEEKQGYTPTNNLFTVELPLPENTTLVGRVDGESNLVPLINGVSEKVKLPVDVESTSLQPVTVTYNYTGPKYIPDQEKLRLESAITTQYFLQFTKRPESVEPELPEPPVAEPLPVNRTVDVRDFPDGLIFSVPPSLGVSLNEFVRINAETTSRSEIPDYNAGELDSINYTVTLPENEQELGITTGHPDGNDVTMFVTRSGMVESGGLRGASMQKERYDDTDQRPQSFIGQPFYPGNKFTVEVRSNDNYRTYDVTLVKGDAIEPGEEQAIPVAGDLPDPFDLHGPNREHNESYTPGFQGLVGRNDNSPINWTVDVVAENRGSSISPDAGQLRLKDTTLIGKIAASTDLVGLFKEDSDLRHRLLLQVGGGYHAKLDHERGLLDGANPETGEGDGGSWTASLQYNLYAAEDTWKFNLGVTSLAAAGLTAKQDLPAGSTPVNGRVPDAYQRAVEETPWDVDVKLHVLTQPESGLGHARFYAGVADAGSTTTTTLSPVVDGTPGDPDLTSSSYRRLTTPYAGLSGTYNFTEWLGLGIGFEGRYTVASSDRAGDVPNDTQLEALLPLEAQVNLSGAVRLAGTVAPSTQDLSRTTVAGTFCVGGTKGFHDRACIGVSSATNSHSLGPEYDGFNITVTYEEN